MNWLAWKMLTGDRAKYVGIVFGISLGTLLIAQQTAIFVGLMRRTSSQILDVSDAGIWVMDRWTQNVDEIRPMPETRLYQVRGVSGVAWATRLFKGQVRIRLDDGRFRQGVLIGLDDATLAGAPRTIVLGTIDDLRRPDGIFIDDEGYKLLFPGEPLEVGRTVEMNDRRAVIVGICKAHAPFQSFPVVFTRYSQATRFVPRERNVLSFILAKPQPDRSTKDVCQEIERQTGLRAMSWDEFFWFNIWFYIENTGIPINFGITVALGFIVGGAIAGQTFYLFTLENLKQFGTLKAMGVTNTRLIRMVLLQASLTGTIGYAIGMGMAAAFFEIMQRTGQPELRGMFVPWQVAVMSGVSVGIIILIASMISLRKVLVLEPAIVFK